MNNKSPIKTIKEKNKIIKEIINIFKKSKNILFISYIDPDALGSMIALGLVLKNLNKNVSFYIPKLNEIRINYLNEIINYNNLVILEKINFENTDEYECIVLNDTANHKIIPNFKKLQKLLNKKNIEIIEIDHHFGTDASKISKKSIALFEKANANCEIITKLLYKMDKDLEIKQIYGESIFKRNIILALITGIITDTQFGKYLVNKLQYLLIMRFLSYRLELSTFSKNNFFKTPHEIYSYLIQVSQKNQKCIKKLLQHIQKFDNYYILDLSDISKKEIEECKNIDFDEIAEVLANKIPEMHSKIGAVIIDRKIDNIDFKQIKIRRSMNYKNFNLKELEDEFKNIFKENFIGGGGHEGACSYRIKNNLSKKDFYEKLHKVLKLIPDK